MPLSECLVSLHKHEAPVENFLATVLSKLCAQVELKNIEIRKNKKLGYFVVKAVRSRNMPECRSLFQKSPFGGQSWGATALLHRDYKVNMMKLCFHTLKRGYSTSAIALFKRIGNNRPGIILFSQKLAQIMRSCSFARTQKVFHSSYR